MEALLIVLVVFCVIVWYVGKWLWNTAFPAIFGLIGSLFTLLLWIAVFAVGFVVVSYIVWLFLPSKSADDGE